MLIILVGVSIATLTGEKGLLTKATKAKVENDKAKVLDLARLAYSTEVIDQLGKQPSDETVLSAIIEALEEEYEVVTVLNSGSTYEGLDVLEMVGDTGTPTTEVTLQQTDSKVIKVNLKMTEGTSKVYVNISGEYYELSINSGNITIAENSENITGETYTIKIVPTTRYATMKLGEVEINDEQTIVSGATITVTALTDIYETGEGFTIKVLKSDGTLQDTINGTVKVVQKPIHAETLTITAEGGATTLNVDETLQLTAVVTPDIITDTIEWSSSAPNIATVSNTGLVSGVEAGSVTITVKTKDSAGIEYKSTTFVLTVISQVALIECYHCGGSGVCPICRGRGEDLCGECFGFRNVLCDMRRDLRRWIRGYSRRTRLLLLWSLQRGVGLCLALAVCGTGYCYFCGGCGYECELGSDCPNGYY